MTTVVTSFGPSGYMQYGRNFIETFWQFWPADVDLRIYHEGPAPDGVGDDGVDLLATEPCAAFLDRHKDNPIVQGRQKHPGHTWRPNAVRAQNNFRFDAYKFARKVFAIAHAARHAEGKLFWLDADIETFAPFPVDLLHTLLPDDVSICHIARPGYHSECGFVGYNLERDETRRFITDFEHVYAADLFFKHKEWHDSWIFDRMLEQSGVAVKPIPWGDKHKLTPVEHSVLGQYLIHFKGARKFTPQAKDTHRKAVTA